MPSPLAPFRVLDLTTGLAGPYCTRTLADLGAEVIKVEPPGGDYARTVPPLDEASASSSTFVEFNCGKRGIRLDPGLPAERHILGRLAYISDVLVEDWDEHDLELCGMAEPGLSARFPWLVHCSLSPYGRTGPYSRRPGTGLTADAAGALLDQTGFENGPPLPLGYAFGEMNTGIHAAAAIIASLFRQRTVGTGQYIDLAMLDCTLAVHEMPLQEYLFSEGRVVRTRAGPDRASLVPYGVYCAPDGYIALTGWERFCRAIGRPELASDPRFATPRAREQHKAEVKSIIETWFGEVGSAREAERRLLASDMVAFRSRPIEEAVKDPQVAARELLVEVVDPAHGKMLVRNSPFHFSSTSSRARGPAPLLGEHNREVLSDLCGFDPSGTAGDKRFPGVNRAEGGRGR